MNRTILLTFIILFLMAESCNSQHRNSQAKNNRQPAVAGQFYPSNPDVLKNDLKKLFDKALPRQLDNVRAIIVPHAGYVFSGEVAASGFNQLDPDKQYKNIFVIGTSHRTYFDAASVYCEGDFITPLGTVEVNIDLANKLIQDSPYFKNYKDAHWFEHSLEVELPFLQYHLKQPFQIVPIVIGTNNASTCKKIAEALKPYFTDENLFVISTDFSHYPSYADALKVDKITAEAIEKNSPELLQNVLKNNEKLKIPNLQTSLCGWTSVLTLLYITEQTENITIKTIQYKNSGEQPLYGDTTRVVGYWAIAAYTDKTTKEKEFSLSEQDKKVLLDIARSTLNDYIKKGTKPKLYPEKYSDNIKQSCGAFVSLYKKGSLRGCIGQFTPDKPLYEVIQDVTISSATQDSRFLPVTPSELNDISIEISVLSPMKKIASIDEIELGTHGIYIKKGYRAGTFLPQVATQTGWTKEEFLGHCAQDKAGIGWDGWKNADIYIYTAIVFGDKQH